MNALLDAALAMQAAGLSVVPVAADGSKRPAVNWRDYQNSPPGPDQLHAWFGPGTTYDGLGVVCGNVSGNLEMLELEGRAATLVIQLAQKMAAAGLSTLWGRIASGYLERSPSGGLHWLYRVDGPARPNTKLARRPNPDNPKLVDVLIETRGEGGFTVTAPSGGRSHPTGKPWMLLSGTPDSIPVISVDERDALHHVCTLFDQMPVIDNQPRQASGTAEFEGTRPGDDFNARASWDDILDGWTRAKSFGGGAWGWTRPGKHPRDGISATTGRNDGDNLFVFTSSTEFDTEQPYSKFAAYALLEHGGDYSAAAKQLRADGYGEHAPLSPEDHHPSTPSDPFGTGLPAPPSQPVEQAAQQSPAAPQARVLTVVDGTAARTIQTAPDNPVDLPVDLTAARYGPTEDGTARALVELHAHELRYCPQRGRWLAWNGHKWCWDEAETYREKIRQIARHLPSSDSWRTYKKRALSAAGVTGIARHAQTDQAITVHIDELDARPFELNTPGGIVDLRTGQLNAPDPAALHTRVTGATPNFSADTTLLDDFLRTTFGGNTEVIAYVQRLFGLAAIGQVLEQILPFGHGSGANGKSTLLEAVMHALGRGEHGYAIAAAAEMLMVRKHTEHPAEIAQLAGARLVVCSELDDGQRFAEARIKQLTGRDSLNARFMRRDPFTFTPSHTIWLLGNHKPATSTGGPAFWRRTQLIPFDHVVPEEQRDPMLGEKLAKQADVVLAWVVQGAADYMTGGLRVPVAVKTATAEYAHDQDTVGRFVEDECSLGAVHQVEVGVLRARYERWCDDAGDTPVSARRFTQELRDRYVVESVKGGFGRRYYRGVALLDLDERSATGEPETKEWWQ